MKKEFESPHVNDVDVTPFSAFSAFCKKQEGLDYMRKYYQRNKVRLKKLRDNPEKKKKRKILNQTWIAIPDKQEQKKENQRKRYQNLKPDIREYQNNTKKTATDRCKEWYGMKCQCECGCNERCPKLLTLAHVNDDGKEDRNTKEGRNLPFTLVRNHFEHPYVIELQCWNCNLGKKHNKNICPRIPQTPEGAHVDHRVAFILRSLKTIYSMGEAIPPPK